MRFIYHRRRVYTEIANRLSITEIETKFLSLEEIKSYLLSGIKVDSNIISGRRKLTVHLLKNAKVSIYEGDKASNLKNSFFAMITDDTSPLHGEVAFGKGKIKGIAKLVRDTSEMSKINAGAIGTPHFVIGSSHVAGAQPYEFFKRVIEMELTK